MTRILSSLFPVFHRDPLHNKEEKGTCTTEMSFFSDKLTTSILNDMENLLLNKTLNEDPLCYPHFEEGDVGKMKDAVKNALKDADVRKYVQSIFDDKRNFERQSAEKKFSSYFQGTTRKIRVDYKVIIAEIIARLSIRHGIHNLHYCSEVWNKNSKDKVVENIIFYLSDKGAKELEKKYFKKDMCDTAITRHIFIK
jgi:hypothetical protein